MKMEYVCLTTEDVLALASFYEKVLQVTFEGDEVHAHFQLEGTALNIYSREAAKKDMQLHYGNEAGSFTLGFRVQDVDQEYERLKGLGVVFLTLPTTYSWGSRSMQFKDLDGNVISFFA